jgi:hypothetical protein
LTDAFSVYASTDDWPSVGRYKAIMASEAKGDQHASFERSTYMDTPYLNVQWMENNYEEVVAWLKQHSGIPTKPPATSKCGDVKSMRLQWLVILFSVALSMTFNNKQH